MSWNAGDAVGARRVVLWRHGQTAWNAQDRFQGTTDVELTAEGFAQARASARTLDSFSPDAIVASDLKRAAATAAELAALVGLRVAHDEGLREAYAGRWQGLTFHQIRADFAEEYAAWKRGESVRRGGGELDSEVAARAVRVVRRHLAGLDDGGTLVVVTHGGTIRALTGCLLGLDPARWMSLPGLANCAWRVLRVSGDRWSLDDAAPVVCE